MNCLLNRTVDLHLAAQDGPTEFDELDALDIAGLVLPSQMKESDCTRLVPCVIRYVAAFNGWQTGAHFGDYVYFRVAGTTDQYLHQEKSCTSLACVIPTGSDSTYERSFGRWQLG